MYIYGFAYACGYIGVQVYIEMRANLLFFYEVANEMAKELHIFPKIRISPPLFALLS